MITFHACTHIHDDPSFPSSIDLVINMMSNVWERDTPVRASEG